MRIARCEWRRRWRGDSSLFNAKSAQDAKKRRSLSPRRTRTTRERVRPNAVNCTLFVPRRRRGQGDGAGNRPHCPTVAHCRQWGNADPAWCRQACPTPGFTACGVKWTSPPRSMLVLPRRRVMFRRRCEVSLSCIVNIAQTRRARECAVEVTLRRCVREQAPHHSS